MYALSAETNNLEPQGVIDAFFSCLITRRYQAPGDIQLELPVAAREDAVRLKPGMWLWPDDGKECFIVETITIQQDEERGWVMNAQGRTAWAVLGWRVTHDMIYGEGPAFAIVNTLLAHVFDGYPFRQFPCLTVDTGTMAGEPLRYEIRQQTLLESITNLCRATGSGMRSEFDYRTGTITCVLYRGRDLTQDNDYGPILFDERLDNISDVIYTESIRDSATMAYVIGEIRKDENGVNTYYWQAYDPAQSAGYDRREVALTSGLTGDTGEVDEEGETIYITDEEYHKLLLDYGMEQLPKYATVTSVDGALQANSALFQLDVDYTIGDTVAVQNAELAVSYHSQVVEVELLYDKLPEPTVRITIGDALPTMVDQIERLG